MAANVGTVIFHGGSISENVTRVMVYICVKFHASTYKPTIFLHICWTIHALTPLNLKVCVPVCTSRTQTHTPCQWGVGVCRRVCYTQTYNFCEGVCVCHILATVQISDFKSKLRFQYFRFSRTIEP